MARAAGTSPALVSGKVAGSGGSVNHRADRLSTGGRRNQRLQRGSFTTTPGARKLWVQIVEQRKHELASGATSITSYQCLKRWSKGSETCRRLKKSELLGGDGEVTDEDDTALTMRTTPRSPLQPAESHRQVQANRRSRRCQLDCRGMSALAATVTSGIYRQGST